MSTEIRLVEGESIRVSDEYRDVYERLLAANWEKPVEFKQHHVTARARSPSTRHTSFTFVRARGRRSIRGRRPLARRRRERNARSSRTSCRSRCHVR